MRGRKCNISAGWMERVRREMRRRGEERRRRRRKRWGRVTFQQDGWPGELFTPTARSVNPRAASSPSQRNIRTNKICCLVEFSILSETPLERVQKYTRLLKYFTITHFEMYAFLSQF